MTREASASLSVWVRPSIASRKRTNCWSRLAVTSADGGDAGVEIVQVVAHRAGNVLRALAEPLDHLAAIGLHGAVELGEVAVMRLPSVVERSRARSASSEPP